MDEMLAAYTAAAEAAAGPFTGAIFARGLSPRDVEALWRAWNWAAPLSDSPLEKGWYIIE